MSIVLGINYGLKYVLTGPDGTRAVFNDEADEDYVGILAAEECSGLDSADVREDAQDRTDEHGGLHGNFYFGRRPIVLGGMVRFTSVAEREERVQKLQRASAGLTGDSTLAWTSESGASVSISVRRQQPLRIAGTYNKKFQLALVCADHRITGTTKREGEEAVQTVGKAPGTVENNASFGVVAWTNPANAVSSNNVYATATLNNNASQYLLAKNFGFAVPSAATILNVTPLPERKASIAESAWDIRMRLVKGGTIQETDKSAASSVKWPTTDGTREYNYSVNSWVVALEPADVNAATFGYAMAGTSGTTPTLSIDYMPLYVSYMPHLILTNEGDALADGVIKVRGPLTDGLTVRNITTGQQLYLPEASLAAFEYLYLDLGNRTITTGSLTGTNKYEWLSLAFSEWFKLAPGANEIALYANGTEGNTRLGGYLYDQWY